MAKKKLNVALIGTKFMGKVHSNAFRQVGRYFDLPVEPVMKVICGRNRDETEAAAHALGWAEASTNWRQVVARPDIDVVDITAPNNVHAEMAVAAAKAGKHVICEKPLAMSVVEGRAMVAAVKRAGVKHLCAYSNRFAPAVATIKEMIRRGELGHIYHFRGAYQQDWILDPSFPLNWRLQKNVAGLGSLGDIGAHVIDLCHHLVGPISEVSASLRTFVKKRPISETSATIAAISGHRKSGKMGRVDVDDAAIVLAHIEGADTLATFEATRFAAGHRNHNTVEVYGSKGSVIWNQEDMNVFQYYNVADPGHVQGFRRIQATDAGHPYIGAWWPAGHIIGYEHLFVHEVYEFLRQINRKHVTYPTFDDGLLCQRVLEAVVKAARSRRWVEV